MTQPLLLAILALPPTSPITAQTAPAPVATASRTELPLRDAFASVFEREKAPYIIGPGIEGKISLNLELKTLPLGDATHLLMAASDKPLVMERQGGVWIVKLAPTTPPAPPQVNVAPAQVTVNNVPPKSPTIGSLNLASNGQDPLLALLELQFNLLEQELAAQSVHFGPDNEQFKSTQSQILVVKQQLATRRAQLDKKVTATNRTTEPRR